MHNPSNLLVNADTSSKTTDEVLLQLGEQFRALRLRKNLEQSDLARLANVGISSIHKLEGGKGSTLSTVVKVARALGQSDWLASLAPRIAISPMEMFHSTTRHTRVRAYKPRKRTTEE